MKYLLKLYIKRALALFLKTHGNMPMKDLRKVFLGITSELVSADDVDIDIQQVQRGIFREELNNLISYYQAESLIVHHDLTNEPVLE
ncbi:hypothetical protein, partial [Oenococcus oeni]|uniref:hypothetical protein n=1 Tax=Oenococcus oeni TaxID=1247 RepID=UPI001C5B8DA7